MRVSAFDSARRSRGSEPALESALASALLASIAARTARVGVIGLGYVGLPLAIAAARTGFVTTGFDVDPAKPRLLAKGRSYIAAVDGRDVERLIADARFSATTKFAELGTCDVIVICVPTPLTRNREPDLSYVEATAREVAKRLRKGQLVVLESTTWPGTTREVLKPVLELTGLVSGVDFFLGFSPEREDPGNASFDTAPFRKWSPAMARIAGTGRSLLRPRREKGRAGFDAGRCRSGRRSENIFRAVNIALVNELKLVYGAMGIDIWEVIEAAKTKPFGYMPFYPGPGLGGHCIPIDPYYLTWKSREYDVPTRFIELAGEINHAMPRHVVDVLAKTLDARTAKGLSGAAVLVARSRLQEERAGHPREPRAQDHGIARCARCHISNSTIPMWARSRQRGNMAASRDANPSHSRRSNSASATPSSSHRP